MIMSETKPNFKSATLAWLPYNQQIPARISASKVARAKPVPAKNCSLLFTKATMYQLSVREAAELPLPKDAKRLESTLAQLRMRRHDWRCAGFYGS